MLEKIFQILLIDKLVLLLLLFTVLTSCVQENIQIETIIKPNKRYLKKINIISKSETNIIADKESLAMVESNGLKLPFITIDETIMTTEIITNKKDDNGEFSVTKKYIEMTTSNTLNGKTNTDRKPYSGMKILGKYDVNNEFIIDSIIGVRLTPRLKYFHTYGLEMYERSIDSPRRFIKIGDTIKSKKPLNIPMQGMDPVDVIIYEDYILTKIDNNKAIFSLYQKVQHNKQLGQRGAQVVGSGIGKCEFDLKENILTNFTSELPMNLTVIIDEKMTAKIKLVLKTEQSVRVE